MTNLKICIVLFSFLNFIDDKRDFVLFYGQIGLLDAYMFSDIEQNKTKTLKILRTIRIVDS